MFENFKFTRKAEKPMDLKSAVVYAYNEMPNVFGTISLIKIVRQKTQRSELYDATILRKLRDLRINGITPYTVKDIKKSIYCKIVNQ